MGQAVTKGIPSPIANATPQSCATATTFCIPPSTTVLLGEPQAAAGAYAIFNASNNPGSAALMLRQTL